MGSGLTPEDILDDFKSFYYDTALSSHESTLAAMRSFVGPDRLVFGTDFPGKRSSGFRKFVVCSPLLLAASKDMAVWYTRKVDQFHPDADAPVWRDNILKILTNME